MFTDRDTNVVLPGDSRQVCVWPDTILEEYTDEKVKEVEDWFKSELAVRIKVLEFIKTNPTPGESGTGGRMDMLFAIHNEDTARFAIARIQIGAKWLDDMYSSGQGYLYPSRVKDYTFWVTERSINLLEGDE